MVECTPLTHIQPPPFRPKLQTTFDNVPGLTRSSHPSSHFLALSLNLPGPSFSEKGKAKEVLRAHTPPPWYQPGDNADADEAKLEGAWWAYIQKDENYTASLPVVPQMVPPGRSSTKKRRLNGISGHHRRRSISLSVNGHSSVTLVDRSPPEPTKHELPALIHSKPKSVNLGNVIHRSVDHLFDIRKTVGKIHDWQKAEHEGILLPPPKPHIEREERRLAKQEWNERKRRRRDERSEAKKRSRQGGEVGEKEAALAMRLATGGALAHAGFEGPSLLISHAFKRSLKDHDADDLFVGANQSAMDLMSRVVTEKISNLGRTLRLLVDGFSHKMSPEVSASSVNNPSGHTN